MSILYGINGVDMLDIHGVVYLHIYVVDAKSFN